jgi:type IV pilus assembly protein PilM
MQRKSFVVISFVHQKLQVVKLNSGKTRVEKFATVDLPSGLISDYQVTNSQGLSTVIKNLWHKLHLKEKSVGVVVPEFSSFIKPLELPRIENSELDEAVRWQAQEFLPSATSDMVMDWKLVKETPDKYYILTLAMKKVILAGYVDAVAEAGLFPLLVETPSLSLVRLTGKEAVGRLIVYSNLGETIFIVAQGEQSFGSSIIDIGEKVDLVETGSLIVKHYKEASVGKIFVGGGEGEEGF